MKTLSNHSRGSIRVMSSIKYFYLFFARECFIDFFSMDRRDHSILIPCHNKHPFLLILLPPNCFSNFHLIWIHTRFFNYILSDATKYTRVHTIKQTTTNLWEKTFTWLPTELVQWIKGWICNHYITFIAE